jgi:dTDP-6-deoxy-L-talose 4-dehydrogenase (NAD+)
VRILLTGFTGFIGGAFGTLALNRGHDVAALVRDQTKVLPESRAAVNLRLFAGTLDNAPWDEIKSFRPEACVHAAWMSTPGVYLESPENLRHFDQGLKFLRRANDVGADQIVGVGTCIEYAMTNGPLSENETPIAPMTVYAQCKNDLRIALENDAKERDFLFCWGRVFYPYGVGEHPARLCTSIIHKLSRSESVRLKTPHSIKDYIYIEDLAEAILGSVEGKVRGTINWGTGIGIPVNEIASTLAEMLNKREFVEYANPAEPDPNPFVVADASRLKALGWRQRFSIQMGLERLVSLSRDTKR